MPVATSSTCPRSRARSSCSSTGSAMTCCASAAGTRPSSAATSPTAHRVPCGFPSTTATVDGHLRHGPAARGPRARRDAGARPGHRPAAQRAVVGGRPRPAAPGSRNETVFEAAENAGVVGDDGRARTTSTGRASPTAALRGGRFRAARSLERPRRRRRGRGARDAALARLPLLGRGRQGRPRARLPVVAVGRRGGGGRRARCASSPRGCRTTRSIVVTADHGMVDVPFHDRTRPRARAGAHGRACATSAASRATCSSTPSRARPRTSRPRGRRALGDRARILTPREAVDEGWFGPVRPEVEGRIGDLVVVMRGSLRRRPLRAHAARGRRAARPARVDRARRNSPCRWSWCRRAAAPRVVPRG